MKKVELVEKIAEKTGLNKKQAEAAVAAFTDVISEAMIAGDKVNLSGFGIFESHDVAARVCRNPATGESVEVAASRKPAFKPSKTLKNRF